MISKLQLFALVVVTAAAIALGGCTSSTPPQTLDTWTGEWVTPSPVPSPTPED